MPGLPALCSTEFPTAVLEATRPVLVDFFTTWCPPCKVLEPVLEQLADELADELIVAKVDATQEEELATTYAVSQAPTLILFRGGEELDRRVGTASRPALAAWVRRALEE